ncbi:tyrosine-type recombinase/integrase [Roseomonas sp. NAR14]|uniref:Tyrosine-type recombinase/integrase n=1 Tax=Roseomonas acroporae TaxID=2937791 RepID=A0A9X1Y9U8_9PROT|nr:tyrosine-type recombinase/integrase [Roseomonas acroporae]MCK8786579.1 tyrosine-type recombinase/integrase [Roseomonas acroporae]
MAVPVAVVEAEVQAARDFADAARAAGTRRAYAADWRRFQAWCAARGVAPLPADPRAVATFLAAEAAAGILPPTVNRRLAAIGHAHRQAGHPAPQRSEGAAPILEVMAGIRRSRVAPPRKAKAADGDVLRDLLRAIPGDDLRARRDRAMLAIGMAAALRRSELVALRVEDVERRPEGVMLRIWRSKTDQEGQGALVAVPEGERLRPVAHLDAWLEAAGITEGPLFRTVTRAGRVLDRAPCDREVARLVARTAAAAGYDPKGFAGHSLRAGFITAAARAGATVFRIQDVSRHKSLQVLAGYVREEQAFRDHAGEKFL